MARPTPRPQVKKGLDIRLENVHRARVALAAARNNGGSMGGTFISRRCRLAAVVIFVKDSRSRSVTPYNTVALTLGIVSCALVFPTDAIARCDWGAARNHLQMALTFEPKSDFFKQQLEEVQAKLEAARKAG